MKKLLLTIILLILLGCFGEQFYSVKGTIIEIRKESNEFLIHHDEIPGFMMAMTMPFKLADSLDINRFGIGDSVDFRLIIEHNHAVASDFKIQGKGTLLNYNDSWDDEYTPLEIGDIFSNATFLDMDSNTFSLEDSDGKFRFISYIFTRCPMPNMCPAVVAKNQYLAETFSEISKIKFILISE